MAEILTTIFAISMSLLLVGLQVVSERYSARVVRAVLYDPVVVGYIILYAMSIFVVTGSLSLGYPAPLSLLPYSQFILIYCVVCLVALVFRVPQLLHPLYALTRLVGRIDVGLCRQLVEAREHPALPLAPAKQDELIRAVEDMLIGSITRGDIHLFGAGLRSFERILTAFIKETNERLQHEENKKEIRESPSYVFEYFLRIYRRLFWECAARGREEHLIYLCQSLKELMIGLFRIKAFRAFEWTSELYEEAGLAGLERNMSLFVDYYVRSLESLVGIELTILDETTHPFDVLGKKWEQLSEEERDIRTVIDILADRVQHQRIDYISRYAEKAAERRMQFIADFCMEILSRLLDKLLCLQPIDRRRSLTKLFMYQLIQAHKKCVDRGMSPTTLTTGLLHYRIEAMKDAVERREFGDYVMRGYAEMEMYSIQKELYDGIWVWGVNGRYLIKDYPEQAAVVVDVLEEALKTLKSKMSPDNRSYYVWAQKDLVSLRDWEGHGHKEITRRVERLLKKYPSLK
jgi:hypothetical protein